LEKKLPIIVAITKIDKPETNIARVKQELSEHSILIEEWGGKILCVEVSAKTGKGMDTLLESILLVTEMEEFRADSKRDGLGIVLESHLDPKRGPIATILVKTGTFKVGQDILAGRVSGRLRRLEDWTGKVLTQGVPSTPVIVSGLSAVPNANDVVQVMDTRSQAKLIAGGKERMVKSISAEDSRKKFNIILKADTQGSLEAVEQILNTYYSDEVALLFVETGVGNITESDIKHAETSDTIIYGFTVEATSVAKRMAEERKVTIKTFKIIYELVEDVKSRMEAMLSPETIREDLGILEVLAIFKTGKKDMIVGGRVVSGHVSNKTLIEVQRGENIIGRGSLANLQQNKVDVNEVKKGEECGITFEGDTKIKVGDTLLCFTEELKKKIIETR
jgi:translation initiation factor IF-2